MRLGHQARVRRRRGEAALFLAITAALVLAASSTVTAYTIWKGPLDFLPVTPGLTATYGSPNSAMHFETGTIGSNNWAAMSLTLPNDVRLDSLTVCYQLMDPTSFITQTRVNGMTTPDAALIYIDDGTDRTSLLDCYTVSGFTPDPDEALTLLLRFDFSDPRHYIEIGAIGLHVSPTMSDVGGGTIESASPESRAALGQNRPNPFNPETTIDFRVRETGHVALQVFDAEGRRVRTLVDETRSAGEYQARWDGRADDGVAVASGTYFYRLAVEGDAEVRKMVVLK